MESFICILNHDRELYYVYLKLVEAQIWVQQRSKGFEPGTSKYKGAGGLGAFAHLRLKNLPYTLCCWNGIQGFSGAL